MLRHSPYTLWYNMHMILLHFPYDFMTGNYRKIAEKIGAYTKNFLGQNYEFTTISWKITIK